MTLTGWLSHQEMLFFEVTDGTLPKDFEETLRFRVAGTLLQRNVRDAWETWRGLYTKGFQEYVDGLLTEDLMAIVGMSFMERQETR